MKKLLASLLLCSTASAAPIVAATPAPPAAYTPPAGTSIANVSALKTALANGTPSENLILAAGTYDDASYLTSYNGDKLYCASLGACTFNTGLAIGGNSTPSGVVVQGINFAVSNVAKGLNGAVISIWGSGTGGKNTQLLDLTIDGADTMYMGIEDRVMEGTDIERVTVNNLQKWGILADTNTVYAPTTKPKIYDVDIFDVGLPTPTSGNGTNEICLWVGNNSDVRRIRADQCTWSCFWLGNTITAGTYQDLTCDRTNASSGEAASATGLYFEHAVSDITVSRLQVSSNLRWGVRCEWFYSGARGCTNVTIDSSSISSTCVGVSLDDGTVGTTVTNTYFEGQKWAALSNYNQGTPNNLTNTTGNTYVTGRHGVVLRNNHIGNRCGL